jgi:hypothetical protein
MNCDLKPCRDLSSKKVEITKQFADSVYQLMVEQRYGLESCKRTKDIDLIEIRKEIVDWQTIPDSHPTIQTSHGLGRLFAYDERDNNYLISNNLLSSTTSKLTSRYWDDEQWWGDQGPTSECVAYAWTHWLEDGPVYQPNTPHPIVTPNSVYRAAQKIDEWPGENYNGTSVRAGAKILQSQGFISNYYWTFDVNTLINTVLNLGPVVVGTHWYLNMSRPNRTTGLISASGRLLGGHAYIINGVDTKRRLFRIKNSWGRSWGLRGRAFISFNDMAKLIRMQGEVCIATEIAK